MINLIQATFNTRVSRACCTRRVKRVFQFVESVTVFSCTLVWAFQWDFNTGAAWSYVGFLNISRNINVIINPIDVSSHNALYLTGFTIRIKMLAL